MVFAHYGWRRLLDTHTIPDGISHSDGLAVTDRPAHTNTNGHGRRHGYPHSDNNSHCHTYSSAINSHPDFDADTGPISHSHPHSYTDARRASRQPLHSNVSSDR